MSTLGDSIRETVCAIRCIWVVVPALCLGGHDKSRVSTPQRSPLNVHEPISAVGAVDELKCLLCLCSSAKQVGKGTKSHIRTASDDSARICAGTPILVDTDLGLQ